VIDVLIADDQALIRSGLRSILDREPDMQVVGEAGDGRTAVQLTGELRPDVVLMDIRMPGLDGLAATREIVAGGPTAPKIVIITTFELDEYIYGALKAGASGFILKDAESDELVAAVRAVHRGNAMLSPSVTRHLIESYVSAPARPAESLPALTQRENDVLRAMAAGLSNAEIGGQLFLSEATIKTHVTSILNKLRVRDRLQAVVLAYETGLVSPGRR
jgi:DNA-binding NarL/FixJ family response regulator